MVTSQIKIAKSGYNYLRIEKNGKAFCIFETQDYIILDIAIKIDSLPTLEDIQKELNDDTYMFFYDSYKNRNELKEESEQYDEMNSPYIGFCHHDKPDFNVYNGREEDDEFDFMDNEEENDFWDTLFNDFFW
jgi:hypothetical protein